MERNIQIPGRCRIRPAEWQDAIPIQKLLNAHALVHRYLDWRHPIQWLGSQPFLILEEEGKLQAVMACPVERPGTAWIRLFACNWEVSLESAWKVLFKEASVQLSKTSEQINCYVLALEDWLDNLMQKQSYPKYQEIIILQRRLDECSLHEKPPDIVIRPMTPADIPIIAEIDLSCFEDHWTYSIQTLEMAFQQSCFALVADVNGGPIGYLLGTQAGETCHLARIAVHPGYKRRHIATHLITRLFIDVRKKGIKYITLNTQSNNKPSQALYDKMGFRRTGESFGVYQLL
jgi:ribosomal-protein-alanine N-acetyltransferase